MPDVRLIDVNTLPNYKFQVTVTVGDQKGPAEMRFVFWQDIERAPTIDAVPVVHARWVQEDEDAWRCTCCGAFWTFIDGGPEENDARFCPVCGAKMDAKEAENGQES